MAVPWNFVSAIAVVSVIPFLIVAKPVIEVFGVNASSDTIAIRLPSLYHFVIFCVASPLSNILSKIKPLLVPVEAGGPTSTLLDPL